VSVFRRVRLSLFGDGKSVVVHRGFRSVYDRAVFNQRRKGYDSIKIRCRDLVKKELPKIKKVVVTGHSLGASVAVLCGLDMAQYLETLCDGSSRPPVEIVTFACPMVANKHLGDEFRRLNVRHVHYLNRGDIVPSGMLGSFRHDDVQERRRLPIQTEGARRVLDKAFIHQVGLPNILYFYQSIVSIMYVDLEASAV
jgi:hypothetical protein